MTAPGVVPARQNGDQDKSTMRILLFGKNGQVGWELQRTLAPLGEILAVDLPEVDFTNLPALRDFTRNAKPDLIVNAAAYTAVDKAESEPEIAMRINGDAPRVMADAAAELGVGLLHYSTDYVFDGRKGKPYIEADEPNPISVYGQSKLAGDQAIRESGCAHLILRTSWVYGSRGRNFFLTILRLAREREVLKIVDDQIGCPTWCAAIAEVTSSLLTLLRNKANGDLTAALKARGGLYHYSAAGQVSWYSFAQAILASDPRSEEQVVRQLDPIPTADYPTPAQRPRYSVLSKAKIESRFGIETASWETQLTNLWQSVGDRRLVDS
jgi:dTDP-4-dehydrorhamnose reductase